MRPEQEIKQRLARERVRLLGLSGTPSYAYAETIVSILKWVLEDPAEPEAEQPDSANASCG